MGAVDDLRYFGPRLGPLRAAGLLARKVGKRLARERVAREAVRPAVVNIRIIRSTTSGGIGTMCDSYEGLVENLDYKSIRYPGHAELMNFFFHELLMREDRDQAGKILVNAKPPVGEDVVYVHVSVEGWIANRLSREEFVRTFIPAAITGKKRRAIGWTTAASVCAVVEMVDRGELPGKGLILQENVSLERFLTTVNGRLYDGKPHGGTRR